MDNPSTSSCDKDAGNSVKKKARVDTCFVPGCPSTSTDFPLKLFLNGPLDPKMRQKWFEAAGRGSNYKPKSVIRCCEDHFDLENDVQNWIKFKIVGGKLNLKKHVVPHKFNNQKSEPVQPPPVVAGKKRREILEKLGDSDPISECSLVMESKGAQTTKTLLKISGDNWRQVQVGTKSPQKVVSLAPIKLNFYKLVYSSENGAAGTIFAQENAIACEETVINACEIADAPQMCKITINKIKSKPLLYIGTPYDFVEFLENSFSWKHEHICIVLRKLRLNDLFPVLAIEFDLNEEKIKSIFSKLSKKMADILKPFALNPCEKNIPAIKSVTRWNALAKSYFVIDYLEVYIETPHNTIHDMLTFSSQKQRNIVKYLISTTAEGVINFVSQGYGGRTSDLNILETSGFMNILPPGACIVANKSFKHIEKYITENNFAFISPSNINITENCSKEVSEIEIFRSHFDKAVTSLREYYLLNSFIDDNLVIGNLDNAVIICAALVNLQLREEIVINDVKFF